MDDGLKPKSHQEAVAMFRHGIIGALTQAQLESGQLRAALTKLATQRFVPPRAKRARVFSVPTLERWYYAFKKKGLPGLMPRPRSDKGRAQELTKEQRELLLDIRKEYPSASVTLMLRTLESEGRLQSGGVSASTVRRLFAEAGLDRVGLRLGGHTGRPRLRWQAERPMALWHGDVCHGPALYIDGKAKPLRVHGLLDDASRYVIALEAHHTEREVDMLGVMVRALRKHGPPDALYLDNGSTYRGETLATACARIGTALLHARPYDAPARGKMERFWRTLREGCLDFLTPDVTTLHDVNVRLCAFLDTHYHQAAHSSLLGQTPWGVFRSLEKKPDGFNETTLRDALTVRHRRRVRKDGTVAVDGVDYELDGAHLAGRLVTLCRCLVELEEAPWAEFENRRLTLHPVDAVANGKRKREPRLDRHGERCPPHPAFNPPQAQLDKALGRKPNRGDA
jgi:transposase InsO family protein